MKLDPSRWPRSWSLAVPTAIMALLFILAISAALRGTVGGVLLAVGLGAIGAINWRGDGVAWLDTASWTVPLVI